jgi:hypothetical protein
LPFTGWFKPIDSSAFADCCDETAATPLRNGTWGSDQAQALFTVTDSEATLEFDCSGATVAVPILVTDKGEFNADGTYQQGGGAMPIGGFPTYAIHIHGVVNGDQLTLDYTLTSLTSGAVISTGELTLTFGAQPMLHFCA